MIWIIALQVLQILLFLTIFVFRKSIPHYVNSKIDESIKFSSLRKEMSNKAIKQLSLDVTGFYSSDGKLDSLKLKSFIDKFAQYQFFLEGDSVDAWNDFLDSVDTSSNIKKDKQKLMLAAVNATRRSMGVTNIKCFKVRNAANKQ